MLRADPLLRTLDLRLGDIQRVINVGRASPRLPPRRLVHIERREERHVAAVQREQPLQSSDAPLGGRLSPPFRDGSLPQPVGLVDDPAALGHRRRFPVGLEGQETAAA